MVIDILFALDTQQEDKYEAEYGYVLVAQLKTKFVIFVLYDYWLVTLEFYYWLV